MSLVPAIVAVCVVVIDRHDLPTLMLYVTPPYLLCKLLAAQLIPSLVRGAAVCVCVWRGHVGQLADHDTASQIASPETARTSRGWEGLAVARATRHVMTTHHEYVWLRPPNKRSRVLINRFRVFHRDFKRQLEDVMASATPPRAKPADRQIVTSSPRNVGRRVRANSADENGDWRTFNAGRSPDASRAVRTTFPAAGKSP